jgi:antitoxin component YwqK of YwqJK toxin-antitoxin module
MKSRAALLLAVLLALPAFAAEEGEEQVLVLPRNATNADIGIKTTELESIRRLVNAVLTDRPETAQARVTLRSVFSNHPAHYGMNAYPYAVVALNAAGQPDGVETFYAIGISGQSGQVLRQVPWKNGKRDGEEKLFKDQKLVASIPWVNDKIHGVRKTFDPSGQVLAEAQYVNGEPTGLTRNFDAQGRLISEVNFRAGKRHGVAKDYWPETGKLKREVPYDQGRVHGVAREFYATGQLKREATYRNNALHGVETSYQGDGQISRRRYWLDGDPVDQATYEKKAKP